MTLQDAVTYMWVDLDRVIFFLDFFLGIFPKGSCSLPNVVNKVTVELTFEKFCQPNRCEYGDHGFSLCMQEKGKSGRVRVSCVCLSLCVRVRVCLCACVCVCVCHRDVLF